MGIFSRAYRLEIPFISTLKNIFPLFLAPSYIHNPAFSFLIVLLKNVDYSMLDLALAFVIEVPISCLLYSIPVFFPIYI